MWKRTYKLNTINRLFIVLIISLIVLSCNYHSKKPLNASELKQKYIDGICQVEIPSEQISNSNNIKIKFMETNECDSVRLYFPVGGTMTTVEIFKDSTRQNKIIPTLHFGLDDANHASIEKHIRGRFYLSYGSCHWGSEKWIYIE